MYIFEVVDPDQATNYDPERDHVNKAELGDTRKPKLMLSDINRLKKLRALRRLDAIKREDILDIMYVENGDDAGGGFGGGF